MTREELIARPECGGRYCPPMYSESKEKCCWVCGKGTGGHRDYYKSGGEKTFTPDQREFVKSKWKEGSGFWDKETSRCNLGRELRPTACLEWDCRDFVYCGRQFWKNPTPEKMGGWFEHIDMIISKKTDMVWNIAKEKENEDNM